MTTAPSDGVVNAFGRVSELLGEVDVELTDSKLRDELRGVLADFEDEYGTPLQPVTARVRAAVERLRERH